MYTIGRPCRMYCIITCTCLVRVYGHTFCYEYKTTPGEAQEDLQVQTYISGKGQLSIHAQNLEKPLLKMQKSQSPNAEKSCAKTWKPYSQNTETGTMPRHLYLKRCTYVWDVCVYVYIHVLA